MSKRILVSISALTRKGIARETLAAVLRLEHQVSALDDKVAELGVAVGDIAGRLQTKVDALQAKIDEGETDVAENIAAIQTDIDALNAIDAVPPPVDPNA